MPVRAEVVLTDEERVNPLDGGGDRHVAVGGQPHQAAASVKGGVRAVRVILA